MKLHELKASAGARKAVTRKGRRPNLVLEAFLEALGSSR